MQYIVLFLSSSYFSYIKLEQVLLMYHMTTPCISVLADITLVKLSSRNLLWTGICLYDNPKADSATGSSYTA